jgi:2-keto-4-pentenoate hydratase/2-oxohepta-3-ene-1,7-dioic acid hydratase in catechol pathway
MELAPANAVRPLADEELLAPVQLPGKLICIARNYREHIEEMADTVKPQDLEAPHVFMKPPSTTIIPHGAAIRIPPVAQSNDWEGELAVIIGRPAKAVAVADALAHVAGYSNVNYDSERQMQVRQRTDPRPRDHFFDWLNGKWYDTFAPFGPWLVTADEIPDPQALTITTRINGEEMQHLSTARMIFPVCELIAYLSAYMTLETGDVISTGTISGVGAATGAYMKPGDQVDVHIGGIGTLHNTVEASPN